MKWKVPWEWTWNASIDPLWHSMAAARPPLLMSYANPFVCPQKIWFWAQYRKLLHYSSKALRCRFIKLEHIWRETERERDIYVKYCNQYNVIYTYTYHIWCINVCLLIWGWKKLTVPWVNPKTAGVHRTIPHMLRHPGKLGMGQNLYTKPPVVAADCWVM